MQASNSSALTGEHVSGDLLTATIWGWFAAVDSHGRLNQSQLSMVDNPGLSYGLFHALAEPLYSWGVIRRVSFPGVNMDVGHVRTMGWSKANKPEEWVIYNRLRGQYMSALEHAVPERFFNDPALCNLIGVANANQALPACPQGVSAVRALAIGGSQGQRIYTITPQVYSNNPGFVQTQLAAHRQSTRERVQGYLDAGWEVSIHQAPVMQDGWTGAGFTVIDTTTGAGGYLIEGGSNGGVLLGKLILLFTIALIVASIVAVFSIVAAGMASGLALGIAVAGGMYGYGSLIWGMLNISTEEEFLQLTGGVATAAISQIALARYAAWLYEVLPAVTPLPGGPPFTLASVLGILSASMQFLLRLVG